MVPPRSWRKRVTTLAACSLLTAPATPISLVAAERAQAAEHPQPSGQPPVIERATGVSLPARAVARPQRHDARAGSREVVGTGAAVSVRRAPGVGGTAGTSGAVGVIVELEVVPLATVRADLAARARAAAHGAGAGSAAARLDTASLRSALERDHLSRLAAHL
ncbi:MAG: hypothetical protein V3R77_09405, partial [Candidatus Binatia bacterium]